MCFRSSAKTSVLDGDEPFIVEMRSKTSFRGLTHIDYELFIDNKSVDTGILKMSFMRKIPPDIERAVAQRCKYVSNA